MSIVSSAALVETLRNLPLLTETQQTELVQQLQRRFAEPRSLARHLLQQGWLTSYQLNQLFQGRANELVIETYVLLERLGEGGTGQVFKARHVHMNRVVALKMIRKEALTDPDAVGRFRREIRAVSQLTHPNVVHAYDAGPAGPNFFLAMEYIEGVDLHRLVKQSGPLAVEQAIDYISQAAAGLQCIHEQGLIHRDIKPSNLLVAGLAGARMRQQQPVAGSPQPAPWGTLKILDLGLARLRLPMEKTLTSQLTTTGPVTMGTLDFMAPEQALDFHAADIRADIYSLGCAFYFLLTARAPFDGGTAAQILLAHQQKEPAAVEQVRRDVPAHVPIALRKMMAKRPEDRFRTPKEMLVYLTGPVSVSRTPRFPMAVALPRQLVIPPGQVFVVDGSGGRVPSRWDPKAWRRPRLERRSVLMGGIAATVLLVLLVWFLGRYLLRAPEEIYVTDLPATKVVLHWAVHGKLAQSGMVFDKDRITVRGAISPKGLFTPPPCPGTAQVSFRLNKQFRQLKTIAAVDDTKQPLVPLTFAVIGDGKILWQSTPITKRGEEQECLVRVSGVDMLELTVSNPGGVHSDNCEKAVWLEPRLIK